MKTALDNGWGNAQFADLYHHARDLKKLMYDNENDPAQLHEYQTGTKLATLRYLPAMNSLFALQVERYNRLSGAALEASSDYAPFHIESSVPQLAQLPLQDSLPTK